ncbi:PREDICTED: 39S ribosomal protein L20, mitochondrial-like [Priapulus caudatus]|uniref:39S ribosomal protein L20, mitochondrial-like n=1 Tax=Priapulus caudatus TaxID=37621 RepID=A0ABM1EN42_PRICU|nr:PREDICTED: 39S ribosomal protein L20, mitochondrial-like [Priapulus caudatus]
MVFLTAVRFLRQPSPDSWWKRNRIFQMSKYFYGRNRNCYSLAIRAVHKALDRARVTRVAQGSDARQLAITRIHSAALEHGMEYRIFISSLNKCHIALNRPILSSLAIYEPRTFKSLVELCQTKSIEDGLDTLNKRPEHIITRGML